MESYSFGLFTPPIFEEEKLDLNYLEKTVGKRFRYCTRGRYAIYHALKALKISGVVVIPAYICPTVKESIIAAGLEYAICDICSEDLNIDYDAFVRLTSEIKVECVIVPSLYGNPADLVKFSYYCSQNNIRLIDDGAQSFGAKIGDQYISTFGDAGLFAFSPGKSTPGPMGALVWYNSNYNWHITTHDILHYIICWNYKLNRLDFDKKNLWFLKKIVKKTAIYLENKISIKNDKETILENKMMGGVVKSVLSGKLEYRNEYWKEFERRFGNKNYFKIIMPLRGNAVNHKIVIILSDISSTKKFRKYLFQNRILSYGGYSILKPGCESNLPVAESIEGRIVELPIEEEAKKMQFLFDVVEKYFQ